MARTILFTRQCACGKEFPVYSNHPNIKHCSIHCPAFGEHQRQIKRNQFKDRFIPRIKKIIKNGALSVGAIDKLCWEVWFEGYGSQSQRHRYKRQALEEQIRQLQHDAHRDIEGSGATTEYDTLGLDT